MAMKIVSELYHIDIDEAPAKFCRETCQLDEAIEIPCRLPGSLDMPR